uniref:Receptor protein-tyrosine kinase n=1 Tax=Wuchereria bancrofti TaxID=6293 RepID=A0AAF5PSU9_WUCBA
MCQLWILFLFIILRINGGDTTNSDLSQIRICQLRCVAKCVIDDKQSSKYCEEQCNKSMANDLCDDKIRDKKICWETCGGNINEGPKPEIPKHIKWIYTPSYSINITWNGNGTLYLLKIMKKVGDNEYSHQFLTTTTSQLNYTKSETNFCNPLLFQLASVTTGGISNFSNVQEIPATSPEIVENLTVKSMEYINQSFSENGYYSNGTIKLILQYATPKYDWPLGEKDIKIDLLFHMVSCNIPDLSKAVPAPEFERSEEPRTLVAEFGADLMYRKCQFLYYVSGVQSYRCGTTKTNNDFDQNSMKPLKINCDTVRNSPCDDRPLIHHPPMCGQVEGFSYHILNDHINSDDINSNITVNVTFRSTLMNKKPLYFVAFYGDAEPFDREIDVELLGVDMRHILGNATNCPKFNNNGTCAANLNLVNASIIITNLQMNKLYGVTICAVIDPHNLTYPEVSGVALGMKSKANRIFIDSAAFKKQRPGLLTGLIAGSTATLLLLLVGTFIWIQRKQNAKVKMHQLKLEQMKYNNDLRYTNLPKKQDIWELERRNLIIYDDQKLGSGAFGSVYKGRLIGIAKGNKNAQSTLGINLMRAENCDVAVKKLLEYADQLSKSEFLNEISLMKTLGYHERLVNMLACITETEPYCLIVEYCSDGDLLHFLRKRCAYMMKLTEMGIDYDEPNLNEKIDQTLVITLKQLLMFAVQISYGLEYLSQKGFVHRDVAARNILVHDKTNAKIGDFGLCRYIYRDSANYKSKGGRLPVKWMSPEAIKHYEFTMQSDVWSFGILMFEIVTLGGSPYPGIQPDDILDHLDAGGRMDQPDNCPNNYYEVMRSCWAQEPSMRPDFGTIRQKLASQLEDITDQYSYLKLDNQRDYYNVVYDTDVLKDTKGTVENDSADEKFEVERMKRKDMLDNALSQEDHRDKTSSLSYSIGTVRDRNVISNGS